MLRLAGVLPRRQVVERVEATLVRDGPAFLSIGPTQHDDQPTDLGLRAFVRDDATDCPVRIVGHRVRLARVRLAGVRRRRGRRGLEPREHEDGEKCGHIARTEFSALGLRPSAFGPGVLPRFLPRHSHPRAMRTGGSASLPASRSRFGFAVRRCLHPPEHGPAPVGIHREVRFVLLVAREAEAPRRRDAPVPRHEVVLPLRQVDKSVAAVRAREGPAFQAVGPAQDEERASDHGTQDRVVHGSADDTVRTVGSRIRVRLARVPRRRRRRWRKRKRKRSEEQDGERRSHTLRTRRRARGLRPRTSLTAVQLASHASIRTATSERKRASVSQMPVRTAGSSATRVPTRSRKYVVRASSVRNAA